MQHRNNRYFYTFLAPKEKQLFETLFDGVLQRKTCFDFDMRGMSVHNIEKTVEALVMDCPELYNVKSWDLEWYANKIKFCSVDPFQYPAHEDALIRKKLDEIVAGFPDMSSDFDKELSIHNYLVKTCKYDVNYSSRPKGSRIDIENHSMVGPLIKNMGVCDGFAKAAQYLCLKLNIPVVFVIGESRNMSVYGGHAWLAVKIGGNYYHLDLSHDVCISEDLSTPRYSYFNVTDGEICKDHRWDRVKYKGVVCNSEIYNYYRKFNRYYATPAQIRCAITQLIDKAFRYETRVRVDFRVANVISENSVHDIIVSVAKSHRRVEGVSYCNSALNTYSATFSLSSPT